MADTQPEPTMKETTPPAPRRFRFHWLDGTTDEGSGETPEAALSALGYGAGALPALDYWAEIDTPGEEEDVCGETYDHDLRLIEDRDGMRTYECRECGAEIVVDESAPS